MSEENSKINEETFEKKSILKSSLTKKVAISAIFIAVAIVLGGMIGVFSAFIRHAVKKRLKEIEVI